MIPKSGAQIMPHFQQAFSHKFASMAVHFGAGMVRQLPFRVDELGAKRALVLSTPSQSDVALRLASYLGSLAGGVYTSLSKETPDDIADDAVQHLRHTRADCTVRSAVICNRPGKMVAPVKPPLRHTDETFRSKSCLPVRRIRADLGVPPHHRGKRFGAMAHAVEALYAPNRSPHRCCPRRPRAFASALPA